MTKLILILLVLSTSFAFAEDADIADSVINPEETTPVISTGMEEEKKEFNPKASHWVTRFGFETIKYNLPWIFDEGQRRTYTERDQELHGLNLNVGREFHLGGGLMTSTKGGAYYHGTVFEKAKTADPQITEERFSFAKRTGQFWGFEVSQSLSMLFDFRTKNFLFDNMVQLTLEPFVEAGIGMAQAYNRIRYNYDTTSGSAIGGACNGTSCDVNEIYNHKIEDKVNTRRLTAGVNILARTGYFFTANVSFMQFDVTDRKQTGFQKNNAVGGDRITDFQDGDENFTNTAFAIGGGLKF